MSNVAQDSFKEASRHAVDFINGVEKHLDLNDVMQEKLGGLCVFEKAAFYRSINANFFALAAVEKELAAIDAVLDRCSITEHRPGTLQSSHAKDEVHDKEKACIETVKMFDQVPEHAEDNRNPSRLWQLPRKLFLVKRAKHADRCPSLPSASEFQGFSFKDDADIENVEIQAAADSINTLLFDDTSTSRFTRFKTFFNIGFAHSFHRKKAYGAQSNGEPNLDSGADADCDSSAETLLTARKAIITSSDSSDCRLSTESHGHSTSDVSRLGAPFNSQFTASRKDQIEGLGKHGMDELQKVMDVTMDIRSIDDVFVDIPQNQLEKAQISVKRGSLEHSVSCFSLNRQNAGKTGSRDTSVDEYITSGEQRSKTLRKRFSSVFGSSKSNGTIVKGGTIGNLISRRMFGRKSLPNWDLSK